MGKKESTTVSSDDDHRGLLSATGGDTPDDPRRKARIRVARNQQYHNGNRGHPMAPRTREPDNALHPVGEIFRGRQ